MLLSEFVVPIFLCSAILYSRITQLVQEEMPEHAADVFEKCVNERALILSGDTDRYRVS